MAINSTRLGEVLPGPPLKQGATVSTHLGLYLSRRPLHLTALREGWQHENEGSTCQSNHGRPSLTAASYTAVSESKRTKTQTTQIRPTNHTEPLIRQFMR